MTETRSAQAALWICSVRRSRWPGDVQVAYGSMGAAPLSTRFSSDRHGRRDRTDRSSSTDVCRACILLMPTTAYPQAPDLGTPPSVLASWQRPPLRRRRLAPARRRPHGRGTPRSASGSTSSSPTARVAPPPRSLVIRVPPPRGSASGQHRTSAPARRSIDCSARSGTSSVQPARPPVVVTAAPSRRLVAVDLPRGLGPRAARRPCRRVRVRPPSRPRDDRPSAGTIYSRAGPVTLLRRRDVPRRTRRCR